MNLKSKSQSQSFFKLVFFVILLIFCLGIYANGQSKLHSHKNTTKVKPYELDVCIVSGAKLGSMGKPVVIVEDDQELKLCCAGCKNAVKKNPKKYLKKYKNLVKNKKEK